MISTTEIIVRLLLGALFGGIIGYERQAHGRPAGFRTQMLVCIASVLVMVVSEYYYHLSTLDPSYIRIDPARIAAGAITGVGFLGAGVIVKMGATVQGLTTAACLWMVSAIGLAVGSGLYLASTTSFFLTLFSLVVLGAIERRTTKLIFKTLSVTTGDGTDEGRILKVLKSFDATIYATDYEKDVAQKEILFRYTLALKNTVPLSTVMEDLSSIEDVKKISLRG
jgi:putative Mg2+ transporter-C (MgtC) family protein